MVFPLGFAENSIQLVPDGTLILHVIIILVMVYVLNATLYKPINRILQARERRTKGILSDVSAKLSEYERTLRQARAEAYAFTEAERGMAMEERQKKLNEMRQQLSESIAKEKTLIQRQADEARATLQVESQHIAQEIGSRVLSRPIGSTNIN